MLAPQRSLTGCTADIYLTFVAFRMASPHTECPTRVQGCDPPQEASAHPETEAASGYSVHPPRTGVSSRRLPVPDQTRPGGNTPACSAFYDRNKSHFI